MAFETDYPPIRIGTAPQELRGSFTLLSAVYLVAGKASNVPVVKGEGETLRIGGSDIDGMMVFAVVMAVEAQGR